MNGWIQASRKRNGVAKKTKNYYTWQNLCLLSGGRSLQLLGAQRHNVWNDMNIYCELILTFGFIDEFMDYTMRYTAIY